MVTRAAAAIALLAGCTTLEGFEPSWGFGAMFTLNDQERIAGGRVVRESGKFLLTTDMPAWCNGCAEDLDGDLLDDAFERVALSALRPAIALRSDEPSFAGGEGGLTLLGRISPAEDGRIAAFYVFLWDDDAGRCSVGRHHGDTERIVIELAPLDARHFRIAGLFTSAHESTPTDRSALLYDDELGDLYSTRRFEEDDDHILVQVAAGKHAFYPLPTSDCPTSGSMCLKDLCSGLPHPEPVVLRVHDVGEPWAPSWPPVPVDPWSFAPYCGMPSRALHMPCASPIYDKLMLNPLAPIPQ